MITVYLKAYETCPLNKKYATEHQLGLSLLSHGLSEIYHLHFSPDELSERLSHKEGEKPYLTSHPDICFNISHCDELAGCAFADTPVGLDMEKIDSVYEPVLRKVLTPNETGFLQSFKNNQQKYRECFYRFWTLKESRIKQCGLGLSMPMTDFAFELNLTKNPVKIICSEPELYFYQQIIKKTHVLSVCTRAPEKKVKIVFL